MIDDTLIDLFHNKVECRTVDSLDESFQSLGCSFNSQWLVHNLVTGNNDSSCKRSCESLKVETEKLGARNRVVCFVETTRLSVSRGSKGHVSSKQDTHHQAHEILHRRR